MNVGTNMAYAKKMVRAYPIPKNPFLINHFLPTDRPTEERKYRLMDGPFPDQNKSMSKNVCIFKLWHGAMICMSC